MKKMCCLEGIESASPFVGETLDPTVVYPKKVDAGSNPIAEHVFFIKFSQVCKSVDYFIFFYF